MSTTTTTDDAAREREELHATCERLRDRLNLAADIYHADALTWRNIVDVHAAWGVKVDRTDEPSDVAAQLLEDAALSVQINGHRAPGSDEWDIDGAEIVFTTGGPHVQVDTARKVVEAWGWFGAGRTAVSLSADTCEWLEAWAGIES